MFSQHSIHADTISCSSHTKVPIGTGLNGPKPSLSPSSGMVAIDSGSERVYVGSEGKWKIIGDTIGPTSSTKNALARFDGVTGKVIQNSGVTLSDTGDLSGVNTINGKPVSALFSAPREVPKVEVPKVESVKEIIREIESGIKGPSLSVNNQIARFSSLDGKSITTSVVQISDDGDISNVTSINGSPTPTGNNTGDVTLSQVGFSPSEKGATLNGQVLTLQPATAYHPGVVTTTNQTFSGIKEFSNGISVNTSVQGLNSVLRSYYTSNGTSITWDPNSVLFSSPVDSTINCERVGNTVFVKLHKFTEQPMGADRLESNIGAIPEQFRPLDIRGCQIMAVSGSTETPLPHNVVPGYALIYPSGQIACGVSQAGVNLSGVLNDGVTLLPFGGPNPCGILDSLVMYQI